MSRQKRGIENDVKRALKKLRKTHNEEENSSPVLRKVYGPTYPPSSVQEQRSIGPEVPDFLKPSAETQDEALIGPEAPKMVDEKRSHEEVERILKIFRRDESFVDPYEILDVSIDTKDLEVKKTFWRLSLAVHPDKSNHPDAHKAFHVLNEAWKQLQSQDSRKEWEEKKQEKISEKQAEVNMKKAQRKQEWEAVLNPGVTQIHPQGREEWMTQLPELRRQPQTMKQKNQTSFSRKEHVDTSQGASQWTHEPTIYTSHKSERAPQITESTHRPSATSKKKSLLEKHREHQTSTKKKSTKSGSHGVHEAVASLLKSTGSLHDRFR